MSSAIRSPAADSAFWRRGRHHNLLPPILPSRAVVASKFFSGGQLRARHPLHLARRSTRQTCHPSFRRPTRPGRATTRACPTLVTAATASRRNAMASRTATPSTSPSTMEYLISQISKHLRSSPISCLTGSCQRTSPPAGCLTSATSFPMNATTCTARRHGARTPVKLETLTITGW